MLNFLNELTGLNLKDIAFEKIEKLQGIAEYDFYLINLIGLTDTSFKLNGIECLLNYKILEDI